MSIFTGIGCDELNASSNVASSTAPLVVAKCKTKEKLNNNSTLAFVILIFFLYLLQHDLVCGTSYNLTSSTIENFMHARILNNVT